ncbi:MAG: glycosyltransferase [Dehalococcoidia bacterium]|nr:glycosyltransferase [Dehalococcoidia bacterium]
MSAVVDVVLLAALAPFVASALYLAALALLAMLPRRARPVPPSTVRRVVILVPAHDEAQRLPALAASIRALDYPAELYSALVVADNCRDDTARVARDAGFEVCERADAAHVGKGYALAYGLGRITAPHDAVVFVDGDCVVSRNLLRVFNARLDRGDEAVQAHYTMETDGASSTASVRGLALALVHLVRPRGKERIGASAGLKGSGMCLSRRVVDALGWQVFGLAEDIEQHVRLLRMGVRVAFAPEAVVTGAAPRALAGARAQHRRWEAGRLAAARAMALPLLFEGFRRRSPACIDAALELLVPPLSLLGAALAGGVVVGVVFGFAALVVASAVGIGCIGVYVAAGVALQRRGWRATACGIAAMPVYATWKLGVYAQAVVSKPRRWEATRRDAAATIRPGGRSGTGR